MRFRGRFPEQGQAGSGNEKVDRGVDQCAGGSFTQIIVDILSSWYWCRRVERRPTAHQRILRAFAAGCVSFQQVPGLPRTR